MKRPASDVWERVGLEPERQLNWLLRFGYLDLESATAEQRTKAMEEAHAFFVIHESEPEIRQQLRLYPAPVDGARGNLTNDEIRDAHRWLRSGLDLLAQAKIWRFYPRVRYELDAYRRLFWARLKADSRLELFKAFAFNTFRDARFKIRRCTRCKRMFVPVRRQAYCSTRCSQAVRTQRWRRANPEKNRAIRRAQYRKSMASKLKLSRGAGIRIAQRQKGLA